ncbi:MAG: DUF2203 family protein [Planctomycetota bacterium]
MTMSSTSTINQKARARRTFCVEEANRSLPFVSRVVADIVELHDQVVILRRTMERVELGLHGADPRVLEDDYRDAMRRLRDLVRELDLVGVDLQDFERGVVNFPTLHRRQRAVLSWRLGEPTVGFWHGLDEGTELRRSVDMLVS